MIKVGTAGRDTLIATTDTDVLTGGAGGDTFQFDTRGSSTLQRMDTITDFSAAAGDRLVLRGESDSSYGTWIWEGALAPIGSGGPTIGMSFGGTALSSSRPLWWLPSTAGGGWLIGDENGDRRLDAYDLVIRIETAEPIGPSSFVAASLSAIRGTTGNDVMQGRIIVSATATSSALGRALSGDAGNDTLIGTAASESLSGDNGDDVLRGGAGADVLQGGHGSDTLYGGDGNDRLDAAGWFFRSAGAATIQSDRAISANLLSGGNGDDTLVSGYGRDTLLGGVGTDRFLVQSDDSSLRWMAVIGDYTPGEDQLSLTPIASRGAWAGELAGVNVAVGLKPGMALPNTLPNGNYQPLYWIPALRDGKAAGGWLVADRDGGHFLDSADFVIRFGSIDRPTVITRSDLVGHLVRVGTNGADVLEADASDARIEGLDGNDTISGGGFDVEIFGGKGRDVIDASGSGKRVEGGAGDDHIVGGGMKFGNDGNDILIGGYDARGGAGNDTIMGSSQMNGGDGEDLIHVNHQSNVVGGSGHDIFFCHETTPHGYHASISDFAAGEDKIRLDSTEFTALSVGKLAPEAFVIGDKARDANDRILLKNSWQVLYDADGSGKEEAVVILGLSGLSQGSQLSAADFEII